MLSANFDRFLFAYTIGSHIIIVSASIALSLILAILEFMITRKNVPEYKTMLFKIKRMFIVSFGGGNRQWNSTCSGTCESVSRFYDLCVKHRGHITLLC